MKINKIKINQYGSLKNAEIDFDKMNIVYGKNESGKSTLQNYILSSFFGIARTKNKKEMSDYEKYFPWTGEEFSGTLDYSLDNGKSYQIFRDFSGKTCNIYDSNGVDVSNNFNIDKKIGNQFFTEQTHFDKELFLSTIMVEQNNIAISKEEQNNLIQRISNLAETGEEAVSYKKANEKIHRMITEQVGNKMTSERPLNIAQRNLQRNSQELLSIQSIEDKRFEYEGEINKLTKALIEEKANKKIYDEVKEIVVYNENEEAKIKPYEDVRNNTKNKLEKLKKDKEEFYDKNYKRVANFTKKMTIAVIIMMVITLAVSIIVKNWWISGALTVVTIAAFVAAFLKMNNIRKLNEKDLDEQIENVSEQLTLQDQNLTKLKDKLFEENKKNKEVLIEKYGRGVENLCNAEIKHMAKEVAQNINRIEIDLHKKKLDLENIEPKCERLAELAESVARDKEQIAELEHKRDIYEQAQDILQEAYEEMKANITPKYNEKVSKLVKDFSDGKYYNISITDGLSVEVENGKRVPASKLSVGTIDQIYLALRLSVVNEISSETIPIILDEPFAYSDDVRMEQMLQTLNKLHNQIIILTCTDREKRVLEKAGIEYKNIKLGS